MSCAECGMKREEFLRELAYNVNPLTVPCCENPDLPYWDERQWRINRGDALELLEEALRLWQEEEEQEE